MNRTSILDLLSRYDVFFLDAYGVLVTSGGPLPGAQEFLTALREANKRFLILSNDASRSPQTSAQRYQGFGLPVKETEILTSGLLLPKYFADMNLVGARSIVLGTEDSVQYVQEAGGVPVASDDETATVVVVADDDGFDFLEVLNNTISVCMNRLARGEPIHLILPNPDIVFPLAANRVGVTAGAIAILIEQAIGLRDPKGQYRFVPLGKPHAPIYDAACTRLGSVDKSKVVMIGDQIVTDVRGATDFGIDSVLIETGVGTAEDAGRFGLFPTWLLADLKTRH